MGERFLSWSGFFKIYTLWVLLHDIIVLDTRKSAWVTTKKHRLIGHERNLHRILNNWLIAYGPLSFGLLNSFCSNFPSFSFRKEISCKHFINTTLRALAIIKVYIKRRMILIKIQFKALTLIFLKLNFVFLERLNFSLCFFIIKYFRQFNLCFSNFPLGCLNLGCKVDC